MPSADLSLNQMGEESIHQLSRDERMILEMNMWKKQAEEKQRIRAPGEALRQKRESDERKALHRRWLESTLQKHAYEKQAKEKAVVSNKDLDKQETRKRKHDDGTNKENENFHQDFAVLSFYLTLGATTMTSATSQQYQQLMMPQPTQSHG